VSEPDRNGTFRQWNDVVGHSTTKSSLKCALEQQRIHHANLFIGPYGIGKRQLAYALASHLQCQQPTEQGACGECSQCLLHKRGEHPDFFELVPDGRYIKIDAVREMQKQTRFRPYSATRRVVVIDEAEALRDEASNALLKTLEEPGGETLFVLLASEANRLLPTIRSRCQPIHCAPLTLAETQEVLERQGREVAETVARLSYGSPGRATKLEDSGVVEERDVLIRGLLSLREKDASLSLKLAEQWASNRDEIDSRLEALVWLSRDVLLSAVGQSQRVANQDLVDSINQCANVLGVDGGTKLCELVEQSRLRFLGNVNARMLFEDFLIETQTMMVRGAADE
jgi:DNA polymerase-3 subunit delta'